MEVPVMVTHRGGFAFLLDTVHNTSGFLSLFRGHEFETLC